MKATVRYASSNRELDEPVLNITDIDDNNVPHATAEAFYDFICEWEDIDPNGTWDSEGVEVINDTLTYSDEAGDLEFAPDGHGGYILADFPWWIER